MKVYKKWKKQKGDGITVSLIEFIDYVTEKGKIYKFTEDDTVYIGEIWKAVDNVGNEVEVKVRKKYEEDLFINSPNNPLPNHLSDTWYNPIVDEPEYVHDRIKGKKVLRGDYINKQLAQKEQESKNYLKSLKRTLKLIKKRDNEGLYNYTKLKINFLSSPDYITFRQLKRLNKKYKYQEELNDLMYA